MPAHAEFLDELLTIKDWQPRKPRDAWKQGKFAQEAFLVTVEMLQALSNPRRVYEISRDTERLDKIEGELDDRGIDQPLVLIIDKNGRLALQDGHHRVLCATRLEWEFLPVRLQQSDRLRSHGVPAHDVLGDILRAWWKQVDTQV